MNALGQWANNMGRSASNAERDIDRTLEVMSGGWWCDECDCTTNHNGEMHREAQEGDQMSSQKRWKQLSGGTFFKFQTKGDALEGIWRGTQAGKFGDNGVVEAAGGTLHLFSLNTALKDLMRVKAGTEVRIEYLGTQMSKAGNEFKAYQVFVEDGAAVEQPDGDVPF